MVLECFNVVWNVYRCFNFGMIRCFWNVDVFGCLGLSGCLRNRAS